MNRKVTAMPSIPARIPRGMPTALTARASVKTIDRFCFFVAPTERSNPNCFVRSATEMEKAL